MPTDEPSAATRIGQRWPVALAVLAVLLLLTLMPGRIRLFPAWLPYVAAAAVIAPMVAVALGSARGLWLRVEHAVTLLFCGLTGVGALGGLAVLIDAMVRRLEGALAARSDDDLLIIGRTDAMAAADATRPSAAPFATGKRESTWCLLMHSSASTTRRPWPEPSEGR